jgi:hypothetical protein
MSHPSEPAPELTDEALRIFVYDRLIERGGPPSSCAEIASYFSVPEADARFALAHSRIGKTVLVDPATGEIWMAGPFAATPTPYKITPLKTEPRATRAAHLPSDPLTLEPSDPGRSWFANCAWDMLGVASLVDEPVRIEASCTDCGEPIVFDHDPPHPPPSDAVVHFLVPARRWYDDIGFT